jgi:hypothetical protein
MLTEFGRADVVVDSVGCNFGIPMHLRVFRILHVPENKCGHDIGSDHVESEFGARTCGSQIYMGILTVAIS